MRPAASSVWPALAAALWLSSPAAAADAPRIASLADAYIAHQRGSEVWAIGSTGIEFTIGFNAGRALVPQGLVNTSTGRAWDLGAEADVSIIVGGERIALANGGPVTFVNSIERTTDAGVRLDFVFEHRARSVRITRSYAAYPGSPTIETWTRVESTGGSIEATGLVGWQYTVPAGRVRWIDGLRGDFAGTDESAAFDLNERQIEPAERVEIGSDRRSSEDFVPFFTLDEGADRFYGGVMWSAGWSIAFERRDQAMRVNTYFPNVVTAVTPQQPLEVPHTFFGVTTATGADQAAAMRAFVVNGIRQGRPFQPLVTYNTWFPYGTRIDEDTVVREIDRAAAMGVELFVLDAGWWPGAGANDDFDFDSGLGQWAEDRDRFPASLASLADYTHDAGMKFGIWLEPARVDLALVDAPGLPREAWLATNHREYGSATNAQICLADETAWQYLLNNLVELLVRVRPDYLKWDNNFWINCDRTGHGHLTGDGAFAHTRGLYRMLGELRRRFPDLLIENVSGGGNVLDFGIIGYTDVGWMDDRTSPSDHVRHNFEGLTTAFPPAYLLSFVIEADGEPLGGNDDLALVVRSRMPGALGITYRSDWVQDDTAAALAQQIRDYKVIREIVSEASATLLSAQAPVEAPGWDVLQETSRDGANVVIFAFKSDPSEGRLLVRPRGLRPDASYEVRSLDAGAMGEAPGAVLMEGGIEIVHSGTSRAHVLILAVR